ncbi:MAG TPA: baseplate J/gp47 family protein [candidate division Zixibacteria bacterium]|nr:baseplate J/gp47 family protein [candidate division Zixibacteria bacterium]
MSIQAIHLDEEDDIVSIRDRLDWVGEQRVVLVLPDQGDLLTDYLDLMLLRRHADDLRLEVGLVTVDARVSGQAKSLGFPVFRSVTNSSSSGRGWWRSRLRRDYLARPVQLEPEDRREIERRKKVRPQWQRWVFRYIAIVLYILTLAFLFVAAVYAIPGATIALKPDLQRIDVTHQIVADPQLETVSFSGASVPGRVLRSVQEWQAEVDTSGLVEVPNTAARGSVVFVNQIDQQASVPAGTRVSTSAGQRVLYQTMESVTVPGGPGSSVEVEVVAIEPGLEGNVDQNLINRIEGSLSLQLEVRNLDSIEGGTIRQVLAVSDADIERLTAQVMDQMKILAIREMEGMLEDNEFLAADSLRVVHTLHETFSHFPGEKTGRLAVDMRMAMEATAVDETQAVELVYNELASLVTPGYELVPDSLRFRSGSVAGVDGEGRVTFEMIGEGQIAAKLGLESAVSEIAGQERGRAQAYLFELLPLREYPKVHTWPSWFNRIPYLPVRITTQIET